MKLGPQLPNPLYKTWRFVEDDPIAKQVNEYDEKCKLAMNVEDRNLGLAVNVKGTALAPFGLWVIGARLVLPGDVPLVAPPDGRVLDMQKKMDGWKSANRDSWKHKVEQDRAAHDRAKKMDERDKQAEKLDEYVAMYGKAHGAMRPQSMSSATRNKSGLYVVGDTGG